MTSLNESDLNIDNLFNSKKTQPAILRKNLKKTLIKLFSDLDEASDLPENMTQTLKTRILEFYRLIAEENQNLFSHQSQARIENILARDLPRLLKSYLSMPLNYRSTHIVANNKTHYDLLIEDMSYLFSVLSQYEIQAQTQLNQERLTHSKVIREIYQNEFVEDLSHPIDIRDILDNKDIQNKEPELKPEDAQLFNNLKNHVPHHTDKPTKLENILERNTLKKRMGKSTIGKWFKKNYGAIFLSLFLVAGIAICIFCIRGISINASHENRDLSIKNNITYLDTHIFDLQQHSNTYAVQQFKQYVNPDNRYYMPYMKWNLINNGNNEQKIHVTFDHTYKRGCQTIINAIDSKTHFTNFKINNHAIIPSDLKSQTELNTNLCEYDNKVEFDVPLKSLN